jgi:RHH-type proline utilization regulon transcriptional repressor/proline dehydrogenase/delta 1-pyrroline-5-carboxylate dehydrogenase
VNLRTVSDLNEVERLTQAYGRELFARLDSQGPLVFSPKWFDDRLMEWTMGDEAVKLQLFRFIDVLPLLHNSDEIARHLREYFQEAAEHLPGWARFGLRWMPRRGWLASILAFAARTNAERLAHRFIAGSNLNEALAAVAKLRKRRLTFTVDLLGEATITESEALRNQDSYLDLIEGLSEQVNAWPTVELIDRDHLGDLPRVNVSIKLSCLYSQFDPLDRDGTTKAVCARLRPILRAAQRHRAFVNFDMEQYSFKDVTLHIFRTILEEDEFRAWPYAGIAIQTYLRESEAGLAGLAEWARRRGTAVWVRLIKGAYWDFETVQAAQEGWPAPVFEHKWQTDDSYERSTLFLLHNHEVLRPAFGSHNVRSIAHALAAAQVLGLPRGAIEFQMLYGMAEPIQNALVDLRQRLRIYTPYGQLLPGMAYLVRRLLENTANESFLRASFTEHVSEEKLLMKPQGIKPQGEVLRTLGIMEASKPQGSEYLTLGVGFVNEPLCDFSQEATRNAMQAAIAEVKKQLGRQHPLVIAGQLVGQDANPDLKFVDSINPSHKREVVGHCVKATPKHAEQAIAAAKAAFPKWRDTDPAKRAEYLFEAARIMRRRRFELAAWQVHECAKNWREADADVAESIDFCEYYAREMLRLARPRRVNVPGEENAYFYEPRGVTVVIAPWNFPMAILCGMSAAALVTGNTVIMKPAEQSAVIGAKLMDVFREAGLPAGVVNYVPGIGEEIGPTLTEHPDVALVAFTGSRGVGLLLNRQTAQVPRGQDHIKRLIAELGGKNAIIVDDDADLDEAVQGVVASAFGYQGQKCSACSRAIVLEPVYAVFLERLIEATRSLKMGPAEDPGSKIGPVIDAEAQQRILTAIEQGKREARLAYAGDAGFLASEGFYVAPHIFAEVPPASTLAQEEIFGPVLSVIKVPNLDEALSVANGTSYALTGGLYSRSPEHIRRVKAEFRVGNLYINRKITGALVNRQPFGGFKLSGIGSKAGGPDYLLQFVVPRCITENTMRRGFAPQTD